MVTELTIENNPIEKDLNFYKIIQDKFPAISINSM